jgi:hypothetical protein
MRLKIAVSVVRSRPWAPFTSGRTANACSCRKTLVERAQVDHRSLTGSVADLVARRHLELDSLAFDLDHLGFGANILTNRRRGKVPDIHSGAYGALTSSVHADRQRGR